MKVIKLTKFGKIVFTIYNTIILVLCNILILQTNSLITESNFYLILNIICWVRIFITPFYMYLIWDE